MSSFAEAYADQKERDDAVFTKPVKMGRVAAVTGV
jgi:hypothetical protein